MDIITGEKIQKLCDVYIGSIEFNQKNHIYNSSLDIDKCIHIDKLNDTNTVNKIQNSKKIFIYTHLKRRFYIYI